MNQMMLALAAVLALLAVGAAGSTTQSHASVRLAQANPPIGLRPMDIFPPTGL
jgi:hypothetical protein